MGEKYRQSGTKLAPTRIPFARALPYNVPLLLPGFGHFDSFIDNIIRLCLHIGNNAIKIMNGIILSIHLLPTHSPTQHNQTFPTIT